MTEPEQRRREAARRLPEHKADCLLVASPANVRYLTGFTGSNALLILGHEESWFFTDPRYAIQAPQQVSAKIKIAKRALIQEAAALIRRKKFKKIGFESIWLHFADYEKLKDELALGYSLKPLSGIVEGLRAVKSAAEIDLIRRSVEANSEAFSRTVKRVRPGVRENDIAAEIEYQMRMLGAEKPAFETIVASGIRTALPHAEPTDHRLTENELLLIDMGACLNGYTSDMTRVAYLGVPPKSIRATYRAVLEAQLAAIDSVRAGIPASRVDRTARDVLKRHELAKEFVHSTGHGLGLEIHEMPRIGRKEKTRLKAGMVITIEPGVYIEGLGGVRIEDTVLVTEHGAEVLTPTPKEFLQL